VLSIFERPSSHALNFAGCRVPQLPGTQQRDDVDATESRGLAALGLRCVSSLRCGPPPPHSRPGHPIRVKPVAPPAPLVWLSSDRRGR
jgi:hypothetical protein